MAPAAASAQFYTIAEWHGRSSGLSGLFTAILRLAALSHLSEYLEFKELPYSKGPSAAVFPYSVEALRI